MFSQRVIAEVDIEKSTITKLNNELDYKSTIKQLASTRYQLNEAENKLQILKIEKSDRERELRVNFLNSYYELVDNIKRWENNYVFVSPIEGKLDLLNFLSDDDFVLSGQELFKIIPFDNKILGQVYLPELGSGKIKINQEVIIKLNNYPYQEYGSIKGKVQSISLVTNQQLATDSQNKISVYLVNVNLVNGLTTNYGRTLNFQAEAKGTAEIITERRRLIERIFDNLKYHIK